MGVRKSAMSAVAPRAKARSKASTRSSRSIDGGRGAFTVVGIGVYLFKHRGQELPAVLEQPLDGPLRAADLRGDLLDLVAGYAQFHNLALRLRHPFQRLPGNQVQERQRLIDFEM